MSNRFASAQKVNAICDVCGFRYKLRELRNLFVKGRDTNLKACLECWDKDHPQLKLGMYPVNDPQAIRNPRPDSAELAVSRDFQYGWNPVGLSDPFNLTNNDLLASGLVGNVTVTTS